MAGVKLEKFLTNAPDPKELVTTTQRVPVEWYSLSKSQKEDLAPLINSRTRSAIETILRSGDPLTAGSIRQLCKWGLRKLKDRKGHPTNLATKYPDRFQGMFGNAQVDIQLSGNLFHTGILENNHREAYTPAHTVESENLDYIRVLDNDLGHSEANSIHHNKTAVLARIWITEKDSSESGKGGAVCYYLGENGRWYKSTGTKYEYNEEEKINYWEMGMVSPVSDQEADVTLKNILATMEKDQKRKPQAG